MSACIMTDGFMPDGVMTEGIMTDGVMTDGIMTDGVMTGERVSAWCDACLRWHGPWHPPPSS